MHMFTFSISISYDSSCFWIYMKSYFGNLCSCLKYFGEQSKYSTYVVALQKVDKNNKNQVFLWEFLIGSLLF